MQNSSTNEKITLPNLVVGEEFWNKIPPEARKFYKTTWLPDNEVEEDCDLRWRLVVTEESRRWLEEQNRQLVENKE